jgi:hypothetical protein
VPEGAGSDLDVIARDLASGAISRRAALRRFGGVAIGAVLPGAIFADSALARCPKERRCDGKCCPKHAHCRKGRCKCERGFTDCGKKCRNLKTDERNCGKCGRTCAEGETCVNGTCTPGQPQQVCGNGVREGTEVCDGNDLGGETCASQGFASGTLLCAAGCMSFDTSGCLKNPGAPCSIPSECDSGFCVDGVCCDTPCTGICTTCNQDATPTGICANVSFGQDPRDDCAPGPMLQGTCNGAGLCM